MPSPDKFWLPLKSSDLDEVIEMALGEEGTSAHESEKFKERMHEDKHLMTSSCCPAYTDWVDKHDPELKPFVSEIL